MEKEFRLADINLIGNRIKSLCLENDFTTLPSDVKRRVEVGYEVTEIDDSQLEDGVLLGMLDMKIDLYNTKEEDEELDEQEISMTLLLEGGFETKCLDKATFERTLATNGAAMLYSIARGLVISISALALHGGSIILPVMNFTKVPVKKEEPLD